MSGALAKMDAAEYHKRITAYIKTNDDPEVQAKLEEFKSFSTYISGGYEDGPSFENLNQHLESIEVPSRFGTGELFSILV